MKNSVRLEEAAMTALSISFIVSLNIQLSWWLYVLLFFSPDISLIGLFLKNKTGNIIYGLFHNKTCAILIGLAGILFKTDYFILAGLILFGHASFDRMLGFSKFL